MDYTVFRRKTSLLVDAHRIGYLDTTYEKLVELFGEPLEGDGKDSDGEWQILLPNGHPIAVYNYRNGVAYMGNEGSTFKEITAWNIRGHFDDDTKEIKELIEGKVGFTLNVQLKGRSTEDIVKRLRTICDHIEQGNTASSTQSDYHSWTLTKQREQIDPPTPVRQVVNPSYPRV